MEVYNEILNKHLEINKRRYNEFLEQIIKRTSNINNYITINELEQLYSNLYEHNQANDTDLLSELVSNLDENLVIKYYRELYKNKGIILKTNRRSPISITTERHKLKINRYLLSPVSKNDAIKLMQVDGIKSVYPIDEVLGISKLPFKMTISAMLKVSEVAQDSKSFKDAALRLVNDSGMKLNSKTIMDVTSHVGGIAFEHELNIAKKYFNDIIINHNWKLFPENKKDGILYILVDGVMVNTRQKDKIIDSGWKENKLGLVYRAKDVRIRGNKEKQEENSEIRHEILEKEYTAYIGKKEIFEVLLFGCAVKNGYGKFKETVLLSDGATWIRNMKDKLFPDAQQILDLFHLKEKIWNFSKLYFKENIKNYTPWAFEMCDKIEKSQYKFVIDKVKIMEDKINLLNNKLSKYIENNIDCIDYMTYKSKGYNIGSEAIESANKSVLQYRLKQPGMIWNIKNAQNMVTLRAKMESNKWFSEVVVPLRQKYGIKCIF
ncbi:MAG: hypothetical protein LBD41_04075 [Clostridiales Family XIII bacterium]|nr:hypothetical protein [Clostridiales Family XIII bacterium]